MGNILEEILLDIPTDGSFQIMMGEGAFEQWWNMFSESDKIQLKINWFENVDAYAIEFYTSAKHIIGIVQKMEKYL